MDVVVKEEARQDLHRLEEDVREQILDEIENLRENATPDNATYVEVGELKLFRLKLQKEDRNSRLNHRVFYQIKNRSAYIRGVFYRQKGYGTEAEKELNKRI